MNTEYTDFLKTLGFEPPKYIMVNPLGLYDIRNTNNIRRVRGIQDGYTRGNFIDIYNYPRTRVFEGDMSITGYYADILESKYYMKSMINEKVLLWRLLDRHLDILETKNYSVPLKWYESGLVELDFLAFTGDSTHLGLLYNNLKLCMVDVSDIKHFTIFDIKPGIRNKSVKISDFYAVKNSGFYIEQFDDINKQVYNTHIDTTNNNMYTLPPHRTGSWRDNYIEKFKYPSGYIRYKYIDPRALNMNYFRSIFNIPGSNPPTSLTSNYDCYFTGMDLQALGLI